jgi:hypothetical protein
MPVEILDIGIQLNGFEELTQVDVEVRFGPKRALISLFPEPPLATRNEAGAFARREIRKLAEAVLRKPSSRIGPS